MDLNKIYTQKRTGKDMPTNTNEPRTEFQRDFDRIIFSSAFRRLQNKTQVFPLPGSVFVHNRLTHSLEVASVGRSLGAIIGNHILLQYNDDLNDESKSFYQHDLYNVLSSACLCHDIGNPAFGHSGEDAIASFFRKNKSDLQPFFTEGEWMDLINFEGNANAIRILTQQQNGKSAGGFKLTSSTLAAIAKYPCESRATNKEFIHRKKFGFFQSELSSFIEIADCSGMIKDDSNPLMYFRHPFVWLVEAADDICYNIIDLEDAHRLGIIEHGDCISMLRELIICIGNDNMDTLNDRLNNIGDKNDKISFLRAKAIHALTMQAVEHYKANFDNIQIGKLRISLFDLIKEDCNALKAITKYSETYIYNHRSVLEIENAGYNVMYELLSLLVPPTLKQSNILTKAEKKALKLIPLQFTYEKESIYKRVMGVLDYISGMTDNYATDLYKKIKGIEIGMSI